METALMRDSTELHLTNKTDMCFAIKRKKSRAANRKSAALWDSDISDSLVSVSHSATGWEALRHHQGKVPLLPRNHMSGDFDLDDWFDMDGSAAVGGKM